MAHVLPVKTDLQLSESLGPSHGNCSLCQPGEFLSIVATVKA